MKFTRLQSGFSLVELSIVLVILGLLVGGILAGRSLIRASELRSVHTQYQSLITATTAFRDKYFAIPGDMSNATSFWTAVAAPPCRTTVSTTAATCDGNGDGQINLATTSYEWFRFWQHLANAGLIEGSYTGMYDGSSTTSATAKNSPVGKMTSGLWYVENLGVQAAKTTLFDGTYNNVFLFGGMLANNVPMTYLFTPTELWNLDTKIDDGKPATGRVVMRVRTTDGLGTCSSTTDSTDMNATYLLSATDLLCNAVFRNLF